MSRHSNSIHTRRIGKLTLSFDSGGPGSQGHGWKHHLRASVGSPYDRPYDTVEEAAAAIESVVLDIGKGAVTALLARPGPAGDAKTCKACIWDGGKIGSVYFCNEEEHGGGCDGNGCSDKAVLLADVRKALGVSE